MTRKLTSITATVFLLTVMGAAQTRFTLSNTQLVTVPFSFSARDRTMPSGTYTVQLDTENNVVVLRGEQKEALMVLAISQELRQPAAHSELVFHRYGSRYILRDVHVQGSAQGETLVLGKLDKEIARNQKPAETLAVQAATR
jgi:hypothetical protein